VKSGPLDDLTRAADWTPSLGAQAVWLLVAKTIGFTFAVALPLVLVRRLSLEDFGLYKQVFLVVTSAVTVLPLGFGMSAFYFLPRERDRQGAIVSNIIVFHAGIGLLAALVLAVFPGVLVWLFNNPALAEHVALVAVVLVLWSIGSFLEIAPVALQDVRASTSLIVITQFSKTVFLLVAAVVVGSVRSLLLAAVAQGIAQIALMTLYLHRRFPHFWRHFDAKLLWTQATYALPVGGSNLLYRLQNDVHHAFVSNAFGPAAYAVYAVGVFKLPLLGLFRESIGSVVLPRINELESRNQLRRILELVAVSARKLALVYLPVYGVLMVMGRDLIEVLFTSQYADSWPIFAIALSFWPFGIVVLDPVTRAHGERYFFLALRLGLFAGLVVVLWRFAADLGLAGVIAMVMAVNIGGWFVTAWRMARLLQVTRRDLALFSDVGRIALVTGAAAVATLALRELLAPAPAWHLLLVCAPSFGLLYLGGIVQLGMLQKDEVVRLRKEVVRSVFGSRSRAASNPKGRAAAAEGAVHSGS
jgi:O-antigen/teichoic acid export membrane protein